MASVNKVILIGNVGRDPEIRFTQAGEPIANFTLATNEVWNDKSGQKQERTEWHRVEVFGKTAQVVRDYVTKGRPVYIEGSIRYEEWTDKDGNKRNTTSIRVSGPGSRLVCSAAAARAGAAAARRSSGGGPLRAAAAGRGRRGVPGLRRRRPVLDDRAERSRPPLAARVHGDPSLARALPAPAPLRPGGGDGLGARVADAPGDAARGRRSRHPPALRLRLRGSEVPGQRRPDRGGLPPRRLRDPEPDVPRGRLPGRRRRRPPRPRGVRARPRRDRHGGERVLHGLHDPGGGRATSRTRWASGPRLARLPITE